MKTSFVILLVYFSAGAYGFPQEFAMNLEYGMQRNLLGHLFDEAGKTWGSLVNKTNQVVDGAIDRTQQTMTALTNNVEGKLEELRAIAVEIINKIKQIDACQCLSNECTCCMTTPLRQQACVVAKIEYFAIDLTVKYNSWELYHNSLQAAGLLCMPIPQMPVLQICLRPYGWSMDQGAFQACAQVQVATTLPRKYILAAADLNCLRLSRNEKIMIVPPNEKLNESRLVNLNMSVVTPFFNRPLDSGNHFFSMF